MPTHVKERHARLLANPRGAEPRARLAQASSRADFLHRLSRVVSTVQHPARAAEALVDLLTEEVVDFAQLALFAGRHQISAGAVEGGQVHTADTYRADHVTPALEQALQRGTSEHVVVGTGRGADSRREVIDALVAVPDLATELEGLGTESLLLLPLSARGRNFGILAVGRSPGLTFESSAIGFLEDLAQRISVILDATLVVAESRHLATVLRASLTPPRTVEVGHLAVGSYYRVAHEHEAVGGDFFDVHGPEEDLVAVLGDVSGKGVEAAIAAKRIRNAARTAALVDPSPDAVLSLVNRVMLNESVHQDETLATAVCARLRPRESHLAVDLALAGHPPALLLRADGRLESVEADGPALGLLDGFATSRSTHALAPGDSLVLHTDGITEARGDRDFFGEERLHLHLRRMAGEPAPAIAESVAMAVSDHLRGHENDDIALVVLQFVPEQA